MSLSKNNLFFYALLLGLFLFRVIYGICSDFWSDDELQIYLIGLKSYTTNTWPYYGPDVVYTDTQIPGALQGLLIRLPLMICPMPESPVVFLNILNFSSLTFFGWYCFKRIAKNLSLPMVLSWLMLLTWTMDFGTKVVNPSYELSFACLFCIALLELLPIFEKPVINRWLSWFLLGITPALIMQLHMSFVLLAPFIVLVVYFQLKNNPILDGVKRILVMSLGVFIGLLTLIPTLMHPCPGKGVVSNVVFNGRNIENIVTVLTRYLSFASFEIPYVMGDTDERIEIVKHAWWSIPFIAYLLLFYVVLIGVYIVVYFKNKEKGEWDKVKKLTALSYVLIFFSFFFSIKGPVPHTFYILFPLVTFYSIYCLEYMLVKYKYWLRLMYLGLFSALVFYLAMGMHNYRTKSLFRNREVIMKSIEQKNYLLLGKRRSENWRCNY